MNYKLAVLSVCDSFYARRPQTQIVTRLMEKWGYDYRPYVDPLWQGWPDKVRCYTRDVPALLGTGVTHVMFIDAADVMMLCGPDELMERWTAFNHPWVYNAEVNIWPPNSFTPEEYPTPPGVFRYINGGAYLGELEHVAGWYNKWTNFGKDPIVCEKSDQHWMAERMVKHYPEAIILDQNCEVFQCGCGARVGPEPAIQISPGKVYNRLTDTYPVVIHANGGDDIIADTEWRTLWSSLLD